MRRFLGVVLLLTAAAWAQVMTVPDLFGQRTTLDGKPVTVRGTVKGYYEKDNYCGFLLFDSGKAISVVSELKPKLINDNQATVSGTFWVSKQAYFKNFSNVVEATSINP